MSAFYGSDTSCVTDIGLVDVLVTDPALLISQRIARRLQTPNGALAVIGDDPDFGFDVRQFVNGKFGPSQLGAAQSIVQAEVEKDEEVSSATVTITLGAAGALSIVISGTSAAGPFSFTMAVGQLTVDVVFNSFAGGAQ